MKKIVILDYYGGEVFIIEDFPMFYDVNGDFELNTMLEFLSEEHEIDLEEEDVCFMITGSSVINIL